MQTPNGSFYMYLETAASSDANCHRRVSSQVDQFHARWIHGEIISPSSAFASLRFSVHYEFSYWASFSFPQSISPDCRRYGGLQVAAVQSAILRISTFYCSLCALAVKLSPWFKLIVELQVSFQPFHEPFSLRVSRLPDRLRCQPHSQGLSSIRGIRPQA